MAFCAQPDANGYLVATATPLDQCQGFIVLEAADSLPLIADIFNPNFLTTNEYQVLLVLGISLPLIGYITAWAFQTVVSFISRR